MPTRDRFPAGAPCWVDLQTSDPERARDFYVTLFGWAAEEPNPEFGGYWNFTSHGGRVAGGMRSDGQAPVSDVWSVYLATDDAQKTVQAVTDAGGQVLYPPMTVGDLGSMSFATDPTGAAVGIWQAGTHTGSARVAEHGAPAWWELHTRDYAGALAFYTRVFGWRTQTASDTDDFRYTQVLEPGGDGQLAGVMDDTVLPFETRPQWAVYFGAADVDAAVEAVTRLGGSVVMAPEDTPFGRLAHVKDPMGAEFRLVQAPPA